MLIERPVELGEGFKVLGRGLRRGRVCRVGEAQHKETVELQMQDALARHEFELM